MIRPTLGLLAVGARVPAWLAAHAGSPAARRHERAAFRSLSRGFGLTVEIEGDPCPGGTLFVCNHISWADIPVLGSVLDAHFVSKSEVGRWPLIGTMARRIGTVFVDRERRGESHVQADAIRARLRQHRGVALFPEGTTSNGLEILPFRSSLFAAADAAETVQPVALAYLAPGGGALSPERLRALAWIGDDPLFPNAFLAARHPTLARVLFLEPLDPAMGRKALAEASREAIRSAYAAAPNRSR